MYGFQYVLGHQKVIKMLKNAITGERVSHAYILDGERGIGKKTLAKAFAKTLQCEAQAGDACGKCISCRVFESGNHPDVIYVSGTKSQSIGVDDVREQIVRPMYLKPFKYRYKIFIVDSAETLTPQAQNALLKTVEEPAAYGIFLFLAAQSHSILPTLKSRCTLYKLYPLPDALVRQAVADTGIGGEKLRFCTAFARGNIGRGLNLAASEDFSAMGGLAGALSGQIRETDLLGAFQYYKRVEKWKESIQLLLDMLYMYYHDEITARASDGASLKPLLEGADAIVKAGRALRQNANFQMTVELLLLRLSGAAT